MPNRAQLPQNPAMAILPSGKPFHFMSVIDAIVEGDVDNKQIRFVQMIAGGTREVLLEGGDAAMALNLVYDACGFDTRNLKKASDIVIANREPSRKKFDA